MRSWLVALGLWMARLGGWTGPVCLRPHDPAPGADVLAAVAQEIADREAFVATLLAPIRDATAMLGEHVTASRQQAASCTQEVSRLETIRAAWKPPPGVGQDVLAMAQHVTQDVGGRFPDAPGEYKRREALRVLLNHFPNRPVRELSLAIEMGLP